MHARCMIISRQGHMKRYTTLRQVAESFQRDPSSEVLHTRGGQRFSSYKVGGVYVFVMKTKGVRPRIYTWVKGDKKRAVEILSGLIRRKIGFQ